MNQREAQELLPLVQALANGETIQYFQPGQTGEERSVWKDMEDVIFTDVSANYRVKPKPREFWLCRDHESRDWIITPSVPVFTWKEMIKVREVEGTF